MISVNFRLIAARAIQRAENDEEMLDEGRLEECIEEGGDLFGAVEDMFVSGNYRVGEIRRDLNPSPSDPGLSSEDGSQLSVPSSSSLDETADVLRPVVVEGEGGAAELSVELGDVDLTDDDFAELDEVRQDEETETVELEGENIDAVLF
ncbi:hypothetical protein IAT38_007779 [Cryptococcus sp. DSM 104549]